MEEKIIKEETVNEIIMEIQTTFNEDKFDVLVEEGSVENIVQD